MNYTIHIPNQPALVKLGLNLVDAAVIDGIRNMFASGASVHHIHEGQVYYWIAPAKLLHDLPLLDIGKRRLMDVIKKIEDSGVIERCPENQKLGKAFYKPGCVWDALSKHEPEALPMQKTAHPLCNKLHTPYAENCTPPMQFSAHNPTTINPTTINPNSKGEKKKKVDLEIQLAFSSENFKNAWADFTEHRKQLKKPLTERSAKLQMQTLQGMGEARAIAAIRHSVANGWQGIFEPKGEAGKKAVAANVPLGSTGQVYAPMRELDLRDMPDTF